MSCWSRGSKMTADPQVAPLPNSVVSPMKHLGDSRSQELRTAAPSTRGKEKPDKATQASESPAPSVPLQLHSVVQCYSRSHRNLPQILPQ